MNNKFDVQGYDPLADVLHEAFLQASMGKGNERHASGREFLKQPIILNSFLQKTIAGQQFQIDKKSLEALHMQMRGEYAAAKRELLGVIVYAAAAVITLDQLEDESLSISHNG